MSGRAGPDTPPRLAGALLRWLLPARHREFVLGDLAEDYAERYRSGSRRRARIRYWRLALASVVACLGRGPARAPRPASRRGGEPVSDVLRDLLYGARMLRRRPGFTAIAVITLGLGIGATTSVFSLANWLLLRPLPGVGDARGLITIEFRGEGPGNTTGLSPLNLEDLRSEASTLDGVAGAQLVSIHAMSPAGRPTQLFGEMVGGDYFRVLGVRPQLGRTLTAEEAMPGRKSWVAVISDVLWTTQFGRDPDVMGRTLHVNGYAVTVVGVASRAFRGTERIGRTDVWLPGSLYGEIQHFSDPDVASDRRRGLYVGVVFARLARDGTPQAAETQLRLIMERLIAAYPEENANYAHFTPHVMDGVGLSSLSREYLRRTVRLLMGVVALVLVIACANVANMLLFRAVERRGEAAVRRALGATGGRLLRQQFAESVVLALAGGIVGAATVLGFRAFFAGARIWRIEIGNAPLEPRVLLFALSVAMGTALLFGLVPTLLSQGGGVLSGLRDAGMRGSARRTWLRSTITVVQLSLSLTLLVGALLITRTLLNLYAVTLGFDEKNLVSVLLNMQPQGYDADRRTAFERTLLERLQSDPRLDAAAIAYTAPFGVIGRTDVRPPDDPERAVRVIWQWISPGYFSTLRVPVLSGRAIEEQDMRAGSAGPTNVVVSASLARALFGDRPPVGRTMLMGRREPREMRVVGVVADTRVSSLTTDDPEGILYEPLDGPSRFLPGSTVIVRAALPLAATEAVIREAVDALDPSLPLTQVERVTDRIDNSLSEPRLLAQLLVTISVIALLMAAVGLYGVIAYSVASRTREIGIRMALGARASGVLRMVLRQAAGLAAAGIVLGTACGVALGRILESKLFGVEPLDPLTFTGAALVLGLVTLAAAAMPTRAALRVDPATALRQE